MSVVSDLAAGDEAILVGINYVLHSKRDAGGEQGCEDFVVRVEQGNGAVVPYVRAILFL